MQSLNHQPRPTEFKVCISTKSPGDSSTHLRSFLRHGLALHVETKVLDFAITMAKRAKEGLNTFANLLAYEQVEHELQKPGCSAGILYMRNH